MATPYDETRATVISGEDARGGTTGHNVLTFWSLA